MKKLFFFSLYCLISSISFSQSSCSVNTNGIYVARVDSSTNAYLRFFGNDSVITTTSEIPKKLAAKHIVKKHKQYMLHGTYKIKGCFIKIKVEGIEGRAKLEGHIINESIGLSKVNLQNNTYTDLIFFYKEYE